MSKKKIVAKAAKPKPVIDPAEGSQIVLRGQIVTMDGARRVIKDGLLYVNKGFIVAVEAKDGPVPAGFEGLPVVNTHGTIFPGLIELHNHLSYNLLRLWAVPRPYGNRGQWAGIPEYRSTISGPMKLLGSRPDLLAALARYVECKCLLGGTTTSQGIELFSNAGARRFYRGIVRNVEQTNDPNLPEAGTRIPDVDAKDAQSFLARISQKKCYLLHLAEGLDKTARNHFLSLQFKPDQWAIAPSLAGIHCAGLLKEDFDVMTRERVANFLPEDWRRNLPGFQEPALSRNLRVVEHLRQIGKRHGRSPGEVAIAWTLNHPAVTGAIVGFRSAQQVAGIIGAAEFRLTRAELSQIEELLKHETQLT